MDGALEWPIDRIKSSCASSVYANCGRCKFSEGCTKPVVSDYTKFAIISGLLRCNLDQCTSFKKGCSFISFTPFLPTRESWPRMNLKYPAVSKREGRLCSYARSNCFNSGLISLDLSNLRYVLKAQVSPIVNKETDKSPDDAQFSRMFSLRPQQRRVQRRSKAHIP